MRVGTALAILVAVGGMLLSAGVARLFLAAQHTTAAQQLDRRTTLVSDAVAKEAGRYIDTLSVVGSAVGSYDNLTAALFDQTVAPLAGMSLAGATSVVYLVPADDNQLPATQEYWRARGATGLLLKPVGSGHEHAFSIFSRPLDGATLRHTGLDITQLAAPAAALSEARRTGRTAVSDTYQLIIDQQLPVAQRQLSFTLTVPVYGTPDAHGHRLFRGWVLMGLRGQDFIGATLHQTAQNLVDVTLSAQDAGGQPVVVAKLHAGVHGKRDLSRQFELPIAGRFWHLRIQAHGRALPGAATGLPAVIAAAGSLGSLLVAALVWVLATGRARARLQVQAATAELTAVEVEVRAQADLLEAVLDSISDGVGVVDEQGEFLLHNPAAKAMLGLDLDKGGAQHWQEHYGMFRADGHTQLPTAEMPLVRALGGECSEQVEMVIRNPGQPDGLTISVSARPLEVLGRRYGAVAVFHDITRSKQAEAQLQATGAALAEELRERKAIEARLVCTRDELIEQRAYLAQTLDALPIAVVTYDAAGAVVQMNTTMRERSLPLLAAISSPHDSVGDAALRVPVKRALTGEQVQGVELLVQPPGEPERAIMVDAVPLQDNAGRISGAVCSAYDVSVLREREADLRAFAGIAAHDLKNPLTVVAGYSELLAGALEGREDAAALQPMLERIRHGVERMRGLIDDLLVYATARDGQLHLEPVDLTALVTDVITERTAHLRGTGSPDGHPLAYPDIYIGPLPQVHADPMMLRQLFDNLIGNALKYTLPGQPARIDIATDPHSHEGWARIQIADRGIGIPADEQQHVFTAFRRAAGTSGYSGTGLGLAICQRIIDRHGGTISACDNPGGGTRVSFVLPAAATVATVATGAVTLRK